MKCKKNLKTLSAYASGELEQASADAEIKEHLKECSTCRRNLAEYKKLEEILNARGKAAPPLNFEDRVLAKIHSTTSLRGTKSRSNLRECEASPQGIATPSARTLTGTGNDTVLTKYSRPFPVFRLALAAALLLIAVFGYRSKTRYIPSDILISDSEITEIENEAIALFYNGDA
ncbi:MAG: zf-HC2 domain-containing protein [bacterium]